VAVVAVAVLPPVVVAGRGRGPRVQPPVDRPVVLGEVAGAAVVVDVSQVEQAVGAVGGDPCCEPLRRRAAVRAVPDGPDDGTLPARLRVHEAGGPRGRRRRRGGRAGAVLPAAGHAHERRAGQKDSPRRSLEPTHVPTLPWLLQG